MKLKSLFLTFVFTIVLCPVFAQVNWLWHTMGDFNAGQDGWAIAVDKNNNTYITGFWWACLTDTFHFGSEQVDLGKGASEDFLLKVDANGKPQWIRASALNSLAATSFGTAVATDGAGNVCETGQFSDTVSFGANKFIASNGLNCFLVKYDAKGNLLWAIAPVATVNANNEGLAIATDKFNNVYVAGTFTDTIQFGSYLLTGQPGANSLFLVKLDPSGKVIWAKSPSGNVAPSLNWSLLGNNMSITTDKENHLYLAGSFDTTTITFGSQILTNSGTNNIFLAKYDLNGNVIWAKSAGGTLQDIPNKVITDQSDNIYIDGVVTSPLIHFGSKTISNSLSKAFFIAKYDSSGNALWVKATESLGAGYSLAVDSCNNVFASGSCDSVVAIDTSAYIAASSGPDESFYLRFDSTGKVTNGFVFESGGDDQNDIAADAFGNIVMGGDFFSMVIIGTDAIPMGCNETADIIKFQLGENCSPVHEPPVDCKDFMVPNVFTPNGDKQNDEFLINAIGMDSYLIDIYDRWGIKEFHANSASISWDGHNLSGNPVPDGVYFYIIRASCHGTAYDKKGFVQVIR